MHSYRHSTGRMQLQLFVAMLLSILFLAPVAAQTKSDSSKTRGTAPSSAATIDPALIGVWGIDNRGGYDFRADGTLILSGTDTYRFDASNGIWHYWQVNGPNSKLLGNFKMTADYRVSADGKSLTINLKKGNPVTNMKRIK
jgi:hypothetical protein